jgi:hypothetical protein
LLVGHLLWCTQLRRTSAKGQSQPTNATALALIGQGRGNRGLGTQGRAVRCTLKIVWKLAKRVN